MKMNAGWIKYMPTFLRKKVENRPNLQAILSNTGWLFADKVLRMGVGLFVTVWIARYLGPEQYGLWNFAIAFAALFGAFATLGLDSIVIRELVKDPERQNELLGSAFALKLAGGIITLLITLIAISWMREGEALMLWLVGISAAGFIFQSVNVIDLFFQAQVQSKYTVYAANAAFIVMTLVKIILLVTSAPLISFAWAGLAEIAITSLFLLFAYRFNHYNIRRWRYENSVALTLFYESWPLMLAGLAAILYMRIDMVMLQQIMGEHEVGIYAAATKISEIWYFLPTILVASVSPSIIACRDKNLELYFHKLRQLYFYLAWLAIFISLPLSLLASLVIDILFGSEYESSAPVLTIHLWASIAVFLGVASSQYLLIENLQKISFYRTLIGLICNIALNLLLIPILGAIGAAISTVVSYFLAVFSMVLFAPTRQHTYYLLLAPFRHD